MALGGCGGCGQTTVCTGDAQCDPRNEGFNICNLEEGFCICTDDRGCGTNEICNPAGRCQALSGCNTNDECGADYFCDVTASQCLLVDICAPGQGETCCTLDDQCPFNQVCDGIASKCIPGCRDNGDCIIGQACVRGLTGLGQCAAGVCSDDNLCLFGQVCTSDGECVDDTRGPYCLGCAGGVASDDCGDRGNFCLTDTVNGGEFCGVDCAGGEACPFGYECHEVIIVPPRAPFCNAEGCVRPDPTRPGACSLNGNACNVDEDCPIGFPGGDCPRADIGNCKLNQLSECSSAADCADGDECVKQECRYGEGDNQGHCSCTRDADCPGDECKDINPNTGVGQCELSGHDCFDSADCEAIIECIDGGCFIGQNCAPGNDRTCRDLTIPDVPLAAP